MAKIRRYKFNLAAERARFYDDYIKDRTEFGEKFDDYGFDTRTEFTSALRLIFDIGEYTSTDRKKHVESILKKGTGKFRGVRSFIDTRNAKRFLNTLHEYDRNMWTKRTTDKHDISARLAFYKKRGNRIVGETILVRYLGKK